jgi:hypothetical protein
MSRITKDIAHNVAIDVLKKDFVVIETLEKTLSDCLRNYMWSLTPESVQQLFLSEHKEWVSTTHYVGAVIGPGIETRWSSIHIEDVPAVNNRVTLPLEEAEQYVALDNSIKDLRKKYDKNLQLLRGSLINLRTYARVKEHFPDVYKLLPNAEITAITVPFDQINLIIDANKPL